MKTNLILLSFCVWMNSCVIDEVISETTPISALKTKALTYQYNANEDTEKQEIPKEAFSHVKLNFKNEMPDLYLFVESIQMCNIHLSGTYHFPTEYSNGYWETDTIKTSLTIETGEIELAPYQEFFFPQDETLTFIPQTTLDRKSVV